MVIGAPYVDEGIIAAQKLVAVIGDVGGEISGVAVGAHQYLVLDAFLFTVAVDVLLGLILFAVFARLVPQSAVLFVGQPFFGEDVDDLAKLAVVVQGGLGEPTVVHDAVFRHIRLHLLDVERQGVFDKRAAAFLDVRLHVFIAVDGRECLGVRFDVVAVIGVLGQLDLILAEMQLHIPYVERQAEFLDLIARIVDVELAPHLVTGGIQYARQTVAERTAAGVTHMHRACGVSRDVFHHHFLSLAEIRATEIVALANGLEHHVAVVGGGQEEVHKAGARHLE